MMSTEPVGSDTLQVGVHSILLFEWGKLTQSVLKWSRTKEFDSPFVVCELLEKLHLTAEECLTPVHGFDRKLPFARVLVLANQEDTVLASVMETLLVRGLWIDKAPLLRGCSVGLKFLAALRVLDYM